MTKKELIEAAAKKTDCQSVVVSSIADTLFETMNEELANDGEIIIRGFGVFSIKNFKARQGHNFHTGEQTAIPARKKVQFKSYLKLN